MIQGVRKQSPQLPLFITTHTLAKSQISWEVLCIWSWINMPGMVTIWHAVLGMVSGTWWRRQWPHSSALTWKIPWTEEPGGLQSMGLLGVGHNWATSFSLSLSCIGEGNGNPLQCSCLENPRDGRAWWSAIYGVAESRTWLKWLNSSSSGSWPRQLICAEPRPSKRRMPCTQLTGSVSTVLLGPFRSPISHDPGLRCSTTVGDLPADTWPITFDQQHCSS